MGNNINQLVLVLPKFILICTSLHVLPVDWMYGFPFEIKIGNVRTFIGLGLSSSSFELDYCRRNNESRKTEETWTSRGVQRGFLKREF